MEGDSGAVLGHWTPAPRPWPDCKGRGVLGSRQCLMGAQYRRHLLFMTQLPSGIASGAFKLFCERYTWTTKVRAVTVRATNLVPQETPDQLSLFVDTQRIERRERLQDAVEAVRERYGKKAFTYAALMGDLKMPCDGRDLVKMPGLMDS